MSDFDGIAFPELRRALHYRNLFYDSTKIDDSTFSCQHVGDIEDGAHRGGVFDRSVHYSTPESTAAGEATPLLSREAPERCEYSRQAYDDFISSLERINQLEPLHNDAPSTNVQTRKKLLEKNRETALGFQRYLRHRGDVSGFGGSRAKRLKHSWRYLREGTIELLGKSRLAPLNWLQKIMLAGIFLALVFNFIVQLRACALALRIQPKNIWEWNGELRQGADEDRAHNMMVSLFIVFAIKEFYFLTFYLSWVIVFLAGISLALAVAVVMALLSLVFVLPVYLIALNFSGPEWSGSHVAKMRKFMRNARRNPVGLEIQRKVIKQASIISHMALNLSILYRIKEWIAAAIFHRARAVDFSVKLTSVANVMFNLGLMVFESYEMDPLVIAAEVSVLLILFHEMVWEEVEKNSLFDSLKDLNQNRLTKFETALLLTKLSEEITHEPACYNFVEHFYTPPTLGEQYRLSYTPSEQWIPADGSHLSARREKPDEVFPSFIDSDSDSD